MGHPKTRASRMALRAEYGKERDFFGRKEEVCRYEPKAASRVYCNACGKEKLQFDSEDRAERYIEYNAPRIEKAKGYAPARAYWCGNCCCWHVTSKPKRKYKKIT